MNEVNKSFKVSFKRKFRRVILITVLLIMTVGAFFVTKNRGDNKAKLIEQDVRLEELKRRNESEDERTKSLTEKQKYSPYEDYIEDVARNELGLIKEDEIILRPNK